MSPNISPIRLAVVNLLVLSLLLTLVGRLWYLQVLAGSEAQALAERTSIRIVYEQAPRGFIFDREGRALASNRTALTVAVDTSVVPDRQRERVIRELATALKMKAADVRGIFNDPRIGPYTPRPIAYDVDKDIVVYLSEHLDRFPGVQHLEIPVREYTMGAMAAHALGYIGEISAEELELREEERAKALESGKGAREYRPGDLIGKTGIEKVYEDYLAGRPGVRKIAVDVRGRPVNADAPGDPPVRGSDAILTIDAAVQNAAEGALERGIKLAQGLTDPDTGEKFKAPAGAVVALDPRTGEVLALASHPDFDPNLFVGSAPRDELAKLNSPDAHMPFLNRAIAEAVPPGSTFKPLTAAAAWDVQPGLRDRSFMCPGYLNIGNRKFRDWEPKGHGTVGLSRSLAESCDIVYYTLGVEMDQKKRALGESLQEAASNFGFGKPTGIDLLGELRGLVPDAEWKWNKFSYAQTFDRRWFPGDAANLAIGQGFLQTTPLQVASAYAAIANRGTVYRPHVLKCFANLDVSQPISPSEACESGTVPASADPKVLESVKIAPGALGFIEGSMRGTVRGDGTAAAAFEGFPLARVEVAGKTGTAQMKPRQPFSWFASIAKSGDKEIVVVALVEEAGTGSQIAAPIVRKVLEQHFDVRAGEFNPGAAAD